MYFLAAAPFMKYNVHLELGQRKCPVYIGGFIIIQLISSTEVTTRCVDEG